MPSRQPGTLSVIALSLVVGSLVPTTAIADGALLHWDSCSPPGNPGTSIKTLACDSNEGYSDLVAGFYLDGERGLTTGFQAEVEVGGGDRHHGGALTGPDYDPLPSYWHLGTGGCRDGAGVVLIAGSNAPGCIDTWMGLPPGSPQVTMTYPHVPSPGATPRLRIAVSGTWPERARAMAAACR